MRVLIVDDHNRYSEVMAERVRRSGHQPMRRTTLPGAMSAAAKNELGTVFVVPTLRGKSTRALVDYIAEHQPDTKVFMLLDSNEPDPEIAGTHVSGTRRRADVSGADTASGLRSN